MYDSMTHIIFFFKQYHISSNLKILKNPRKITIFSINPLKSPNPFFVPEMFNKSPIWAEVTFKSIRDMTNISEDRADQNRR